MAWSLEYQIPIANPSFFKYSPLFEGTAAAGPLTRFCPTQYETSPWFDGGPPDSKLSRHDSILGALTYHAVNACLRVQYLLGSRSWPVQAHTLELEERFDVTDPEFVQMARRRLLLVDGYRYRCPELLAKHQDTIRRYFRLVPNLVRQVDELVEPMDHSGRTRLVGIHIRHGDYKTYREGAFFYPISAYREKMREIEHLYRGQEVEFLVCSDADLTEADFPDQNVLVSHSGPVVDMYALARCHQIMGPPSSFTQWASFYGGSRLFHLRGAQTPVSDDLFLHDGHLATTNYRRAG